MVDKKLVYWVIGIIILIVVLLFVFGVVKVENGGVSFSPPGKLVKANANLQNPNWNNGKNPGNIGGNYNRLCDDPMTAPECCDGVDNDLDTMVDCGDPGCHTDGDVKNKFSCDTFDDSEAGTWTCESTDDDGTNGGFDPEVFGYTKLYEDGGEVASYPEKCVDGKTLRSLYCNPDGHNERDFIRSKIVNCSGKCLDGACVDGGRNVVVSDNAFRVDLKKKVACNDGKDNDGDGAIDYPDDFSCSSSGDDDETNPKAECQDGFDNDGNGDIDYPDDAGCDNLQDNSENSCIGVEVWTADDLNNVRDNLYGDYCQMADIDLSSYSDWVPIIRRHNQGYDTFEGVYDGQGHTIKGLSIYDKFHSDLFLGLFGAVGSEGVLKNIALVDVNISGPVIGVGGITGSNRGNIMNSYVTGKIYGSGKVGGLTGYNYGKITSSYFTGNVNGSSHIGGLVGYNNLGRIISSYATGDVSGDDYVGGITGENSEDAWIINSYSTGNVSGNSGIGGVIGVSHGAGWNYLISTYWDTETSGQSKGCGLGDCPGIEGKTTAEMKKQSTYVGWDFNNIWDIQEDQTYPWLRWEK